MISIDECKRILNNPNISDGEVDKIRGSLYYFIEKEIDTTFNDIIDNNND